MPGLKIRKDDNVEVITGKDKGKRGRVVRVFPDRGRVLVEHVNVVKRHERLRVGKGRGGTEGGIITKEMPVDISNVLVVCPACDRGTRTGYLIEDTGAKRRVCKKCGGDV
ncbi:MAG TPA: 50S ribosomal protein L24 [Actinomycetota bacterium]|nr:50S ribosomal protein L24 [Actinomycetota bacterium]